MPILIKQEKVFVYAVFLDLCSTPVDVMLFVQSREMRKAVYVLDGIYKVKLGRVHDLSEEDTIVAFEDMPGHVKIK